MKLRSILPLFACAALVATLVGCGSGKDDDKDGDSADKKSASSPAEVAKAFFDAIKAGNVKAIKAVTTKECIKLLGLDDKDSFSNLSEKTADAKFKVGKATTKGKKAYVEYSIKTPSESEKCVMLLEKEDGAWKVAHPDSPGDVDDSDEEDFDEEDFDVPDDDDDASSFDY